MNKITRNLSTPESREWWESAERSAAAVDGWPGWKRAGINVASQRSEPRTQGSPMSEPDPRPCIRPTATLDGVPPSDWASERLAESRSLARDDFPTLKAIGLYEALRELERVFSASGGTGRQTWGQKPVEYHTAKAVGHLSRFQCGETVDPDSGRHPLAHVGGRVLAALAIELKAWREPDRGESWAAE